MLKFPKDIIQFFKEHDLVLSEEELKVYVIDSGLVSTGVIFKNGDLFIQWEPTTLSKPVDENTYYYLFGDFVDSLWVVEISINGTSLFHPVFKRIRDDKSINTNDIRYK